MKVLKRSHPDDMKIDLNKKPRLTCAQEGCNKRIDLVAQTLITNCCERCFCDKHRTFEDHTCILTKEEYQKICRARDRGLQKLDEFSEGNSRKDNRDAHTNPFSPDAAY